MVKEWPSVKELYKNTIMNTRPATLKAVVAQKCTFIAWDTFWCMLLASTGTNATARRRFLRGRRVLT